MTAATGKEIPPTFDEVVKHDFGEPPVPPVDEDEEHGGGDGEGGHLVNTILTLAVVLVPVGVFILTYVTASHH